MRALAVGNGHFAAQVGVGVVQGDDAHALNLVQ